MGTKEWALGQYAWRAVRHDHLIKDYVGAEPTSGLIGEDGWFIHKHGDEDLHSHPRMARWEESYPTQEITWYGPAHELPQAVTYGEIG